MSAKATSLVLPFIFRHHWNEDESHAPYQNILHPMDDSEGFQASKFEDAFKQLGIEDGEAIEIEIRRTGKKPFPNVVWKYTRPHTYSRVKRKPKTTKHQ